MKYSYLILIIEDIKRKKFSSFLTFFAISLGILSIFVITILSTSFEDSITKQFEDLGTNRLFITTSQGFSTTQTSGFTDNDINYISSQPYVDKVYPYYYKGAQLEYNREFSSTVLVGTQLSQEFFEDLTLEVKEGRLPNSREEYSLVVGPIAAENLFSRELQVGANINIKDTKFKVVGVLESLGNPEDDSIVYGDLDTLRELFGDGDQVGILDVIIVEGEDIELAETNLQNLLDRRKGEDTTSVTSPTQFLEQLNTILSIVNYTLGGIAFVALLVGAFGIINTMYVIVTEKTRDIGIMKAIGAKNEDILLLFTVQSGVFGFFGALLGILLGSGVVIAFEQVAASTGFGFLEVTISPLLVGGLLVFGFVIGVFSGFLPAYRASKVSIIESIRK